MKDNKKRTGLLGLPFQESSTNEELRGLVDDMRMEASVDEAEYDKTPFEDPAFAEAFKHFMEGKTVTKEDWQMTHPNAILCGSDGYYSELATKFSRTLPLLVSAPENLPEGLWEAVAMSCTAYLEDLVSGTGIWDSFRNLYKAKYGKWLPFYDTEEDYYTDDVNIQDIKFLVWQAFNRCGQPEERIFSPLSEGVNKIAEIVFDELVEEFDTAPESKRVYDFIKKELKKDDFYFVRFLIEWVALYSPLLSCPNDAASIIEESIDLLESKSRLFDEKAALYAVRTSRCFKKFSGPMGVRATEYVAEIAEKFGFPEVAAKLRGIEVIDYRVMKVSSIKGNIVTLEDASGKSIEVDKQSFGPGTNFRIMKGCGGSFVKYGNIWMQNGMAAVLTEDPFKDKEKVVLSGDNEFMKKFVRDLIEKNEGRRVLFFKTRKEMNEAMGMAAQRLDESGNYEEVEEEYDDVENYTVLLSENNAPLVMENLAGCFKADWNPFYNGKVADERSIHVIAGFAVEDDVAEYIADNHMLPEAWMNARQGKDVGKEIVQDNMEFLFGFYRTVNPEVNDFGDKYDDK